eukprot:365806-Chlamydomonas_euryale.AAC.9
MLLAVSCRAMNALSGHEWIHGIGQLWRVSELEAFTSAKGIQGIGLGLVYHDQGYTRAEGIPGHKTTLKRRQTVHGA